MRYSGAESLRNPEYVTPTLRTGHAEKEQAAILPAMMSASSLHPDSPVPFGYKCAWLAIRADSPEQVAASLPLVNVKESAWREGIEAAYQGQVFISPKLNHWILAASTAFPEAGDARHPDACTPWLLRLGHGFSEVQFFSTHRVVEYHAWARVINGSIVRKYAYVGEQGIVVWNEGPRTDEENALGLVFSDSVATEGAWFPDEEDVMRLSGAWSINPSGLEQHSFPPSLGLLGSLALDDLAPQRTAGRSWLAAPISRVSRLLRGLTTRAKREGA